MTGGYKGLQEVTRLQGGLHRYMGLQGITGVTGGFKGVQEVTRS